MPSGSGDRDVVTRLIRYCLQDKQHADRLFSRLITENGRTVMIGSDEITLSEEERGEFVERFSSEVEPTLWESKRRKEQL